MLVLSQMRVIFFVPSASMPVVVLAALFPGAPLHVAASPWLPLHWALGIASYGLFAAAVAVVGGVKRLVDVADEVEHRAVRAGAGHVRRPHRQL